MIDKKRIPIHVAIIMDGNGRWAAKRGLPSLAGHNAGMLAMKEIVKASDILGVRDDCVCLFYGELEKFGRRSRRYFQARS